MCISKNSNMKKYLSVVLITTILASCSGGGKKVLVMASGKVSADGNTVTLQPGTTHNEITIVPDGDSILVVSPSGTQGFSVRDDGYYLLNIKKDTIAGAFQQVGTDNSQQVISQESLKGRMDSLYKLMQGTNVSEKSRNYNIPPFTIARITRNINAQIIGPYLKLPASFDPSTEHEVYKFYTNKEIMDILVKSAKMVQ
jgi:hypothetical protein